MKRFSLRLRFLLLLIVLLGVVFTAITLIIVRQNSKTLRADLVNESKSFAALATQPIGSAFELYQNSGTLNLQQAVNNFTELDPDISQVEIIDTTGKQVFTTNPSDHLAASADAIDSLYPSYMHDRGGNLTTIIQPYVETYGIHRYDVIYSISYESVNRNIHSTVTSIVIVSLIILLVSLLVWYLLINGLFLQPVAKVSRLALRISQGDLNQAILLRRKDEIGDLASAVDAMASSLKDNIAKLKEADTMKNEFMMITSHNLRTPLTIIEGYVDTLQHLELARNVREALDPIGVNVIRLKGFAEDVLTISTIEAGQNVMRLEPMKISPLLHGIADEFSKLAEQKHQIFQTNIETDALVKLSKPHFRSALWNLLDNAYKFTPNGGNIALIAKDDGKLLQISVRDTGPGIKADEIPHLFTKFHRGTDLLRYDYEGTGIGLYISKLITEQHGGEITVQSAEGAGSTFTISLPVIQATD